MFAISSSGVFWYITHILDYKVMLNEAAKNNVDILVALVMALTWGRFFMYFLVVQNISKMLLTLVKMMVDVLPFAFILICYIIFATQWFST
mgnify:CR=1 FL=1